MALRTISCPNCAGPLEVESRFTRLLTCKYCGQTLVLTDTGVDPTGKVAKLAEYPSRLFTGATGAVQGRPFKVLGHVRYRYDAGIWEEWFIQFQDGQIGWIEDDEGELTLVHKKRLTSPLPPFEQIRVGSFLPVGDLRVFISEKGTGQVVGSEGELTIIVLPGQQMRYIDGNAAGKAVRIVLTENSIDLHTGTPLEFQMVTIDKPTSQPW